MTDLFSEVIHTYSGIDIPAVSHPVEALYTRYLKGLWPLSRFYLTRVLYQQRYHQELP